MNERIRISDSKADAMRKHKASQLTKAKIPQSPISPIGRILFLQKTIGNQAVQKLFKSEALLTKLRRGGVDHVQQISTLDRKSVGEDEVIPELEEVIQRERGGGHALDSEVRAQIEPAFGTDFSGVRVHTDGRADALNHALSARAFTTGQDIFFRQGEYNSGSACSRKLLIHELTHVVQQSGAGIQQKLSAGQPGDEYEQEADKMAEQVTAMLDAGMPTQPKSTPGLEQTEEGEQCMNQRLPLQRSSMTQDAFSKSVHLSQVKHHLTGNMLQRAWSLDSSLDATGQGGSTSGNGTLTRIFNPRGVFGRAYTWQSKPRWQWCIDGGTASLNLWKTTQYTFKHDGRDTNILELTVSGDLSGGAKAEDLHYAKSGATVVGLVKVRTPTAPTPSPTKLFDIEDGGKSSANVGTIADIEATIPIDGTVTVKIPLKAAAEGELADFSEGLTPPRSQDVAGVVGSETIVDLYLGARVEAAADVESTCSLLEGSFDDVNWSNATGTYNLIRWRDRAAPAAVPPAAPGAAPEGGMGAAGSAGSRHQVRFQLQAGRRELIPSTVITRDRPITAEEGVIGVDNLWERAQRRHRDACTGAAQQMKATIRRYPPSGVACPPQCGHITDKMCDRDVTEDGYRLRIDLNNDAGHNFQS